MSIIRGGSIVDSINTNGHLSGSLFECVYCPLLDSLRQTTADPPVCVHSRNTHCVYFYSKMNTTSLNNVFNLN